jgi:outer membrane autotransporter protein
VTANGFGTGIDATTNSVVTVNGSVTAQGLGLSAASGSTIVANNIVLSNGGGGGAVAMIANNATITANGITVSWGSGGGQSLVQSLAGGLIQFTAPSTINNAFGGVPSILLANGLGSRIIAADLSISTGGSGGITAVQAQAGGNIQLTGGGITFSGGGGNTGLSATGANSSITATGVSILVGAGGGNDAGASADSGGQVALTGGSVSVQGIGGGERGLRATGAGSLITANDVAINVTGGGGNAGVSATNGAGIVTTGGSVSVVNGAGGLLQNGGSVTMAGTNVTASGNGGFGFLLNNGGNASTLQYSNGTITASDASFSVQGSAANIGLVNTIATANNNTLLDTSSSGNTTFNAQGSTLQGVISTTNSTSNVTLQQNTIWTMTGNSTATTVTNDSSQILYAPPVGDPTQLSSYKTLTVTNYIGAGGLISLNTRLGTDGSPSDRLVISGGSGSGSTALLVNNVGGGGAQTVSNGILLVDASNGTTTSTAFSLARPVSAGAYDYFLFRGGVTQGSQNSWFLRSSAVAPPLPPPGPPVDPVIPIPTPAPGTPPLPTPVPGADPIPFFRPEVALQSVVPSLARTLGLVTLGTFNERQGDQLLLRDGVKVGAWGRVFGQQTREHFAQGARPDFDGTYAGFQAGADLWRFESTNGHSDRIGFYVAQARASGTVHGSVDGFDGALAGHVDLDASSYGGYWTHLGPSNWYIDAVVQGSHFLASPNSIRSNSNNVNGKWLRSFDRGRLPDRIGAVADVRAANTGHLATRLPR